MEIGRYFTGYMMSSSLQIGVVRANVSPKTLIYNEAPSLGAKFDFPTIMAQAGI